MASTFFLSESWRLPVYTLGAVVAGVVLGRVVVSGGKQGSGGGAPSRAGVEKGEAGLKRSRGVGNGLVGDSEEAVEKEIARLVGGGARFQGQTPQEVIAFLSESTRENSDVKRYLAIYEAVSQLGAGDMREAYRISQEARNDVALRAVERRWAEVDPAGAAKYWEEQGDGALSEAFFISWSKLDPGSALRWAMGIQDTGNQRGFVRNTVLSTIARSDPQRALDLANQLPEGKERSKLVSEVFGKLSGENALDAFELAKNLPPGASRVAALDTVISKIAVSDLQKAQQLIAALPPNSVSTGGRDVAAQMAKEGPERALEWAKQLPEGMTRQSAYASIANAWAGKDIEGVAAWLDQLPPGSSRDAAVAGFAERMAPRDPEGSAVWAATLPVGEKRVAVLQRSVAIWRRYDPKAAEEWVASAPGLTAQERTVLAQASQQALDLNKKKATP